jgi:hypothetical protein
MDLLRWVGRAAHCDSRDRHPRNRERRVSTSEVTDYQIRPLGPNGPSAVPPGSFQRVSTAGASRHGSDACPRSPLQRRSRDAPSLSQDRAASQASKTTSPLAGSRSVNDSRKPNGIRHRSAGSSDRRSGARRGSMIGTATSSHRQTTVTPSPTLIEPGWETPR